MVMWIWLFVCGFLNCIMYFRVTRSATESAHRFVRYFWRPFVQPSSIYDNWLFNLTDMSRTELWPESFMDGQNCASLLIILHRRLFARAEPHIYINTWKCGKRVRTGAQHSLRTKNKLNHLNQLCMWMLLTNNQFALLIGQWLSGRAIVFFKCNNFSQANKWRFPSPSSSSLFSFLLIY